MSHFDIGVILWAGNDSNHGDHLHVEPPTKYVGYTDGRGAQPPTQNPGMTAGVRKIYDAITKEFGHGGYFLNPDGSRATGFDWTHMGGWNRRAITGSKRWSQHAWWNALDIGPLYGVNAQREMYEFLTRKDHDMKTETIAGYVWYDVDEWKPFDKEIREAIVAGAIRGKEIEGKPSNHRVFDPHSPVTRGQLAAILDRLNVV